MPLAANFWNYRTSKLAVSMLAEVFGFQLAANFEVYLYTKTSLMATSLAAIFATGGQIFGQFSWKIEVSWHFWESFVQSPKEKKQKKNKGKLGDDLH